MRVLHFLPVYVPAWKYGGPILSVSRLCEGLLEQGVHVRVITTNAGLPCYPPDQLCVPQNVNGVEVFYYPIDKETGAIRSKALVHALPSHIGWAQLLHLSSIWQPLGLPVQAAAHDAGVPVIQTLRGALSPYSWRRSWWKKVPYFFVNERPLLQHAAAIHCTTPQEARELRWLGLRSPVKILPNPIDLSQLHYRPNLGKQWRQSMGLPLDVPLLLVAGRLHHKKGLDLLPNILQGISHKPWNIVFIGEDEDGTGRRLRHELDSLGLTSRCHWFDHLSADQLSAPYNAADCLLLPSRHENFGNVVIEALACGSAVLISDRVGVADTIQACPGVRVCARSSNSWISELTNVLVSTRPGQVSSDWIHSHFSKSLLASQAKAIYSSILRNV